ncbi:MAG: hypothetical protein V4547_09575 [Bacteroidota bacterium]
MTEQKTAEEIFKADVPEGICGEVQTNTGQVAAFIPILELEYMLDPLDWSTRNFQYQVFKDGYANLCVAASLELEINYTAANEANIKRTFVGACSFSLKSIEPNTHFLATAKSECIKNAASDIAKYFGRGLNNDIVPSNGKQEKPVVKAKPDSKIMKQFLAAVEAGDEATITLLTNIYDIKND